MQTTDLEAGSRFDSVGLSSWSLRLGTTTSTTFYAAIYIYMFYTHYRHRHPCTLEKVEHNSKGVFGFFFHS